MGVCIGCSSGGSIISAVFATWMEQEGRRSDVPGNADVQVSGMGRENPTRRPGPSGACAVSAVARVVVVMCSAVLLGLGLLAGCRDEHGRWQQGAEAAVMGHSERAWDVTGVAAQELGGRQQEPATRVYDSPPGFGSGWTWDLKSLICQNGAWDSRLIKLPQTKYRTLQ
ncbi:hypothetical protein B0H10DRAFT_1954992 [Mycena sp. CBHHK59/15]|nr:hypothetical protein B0H10DRAFT_1954992 [Mycena sp. CBHHK59/15]